MNPKSFGKIGVLMGGPSNEREISIKSGTAVFSALNFKGFNVIPIELGSSDGILQYEREVEKEIRNKDIDFAFIAMHGEFGEDGRVQELLERLNIPYTGSGVLASKRGMDKIESKKLFMESGIPVPDFKVISNSERLKSWPKELGKRIVVKPSNQGSSIGVSFVEDLETLNQAIKKIKTFCERIILERFIEGKELTVGILEDRPLPVIHILPKKEEFFNYKAKYSKDRTDYIVPAQLKGSVYRRCQETALKAHKALGAKFFSRVDMVLSKEGEVFVLELNTIPGMTTTSLLPKAAKAVGISFEDLCVKILSSSLLK